MKESRSAKWERSVRHRREGEEAPYRQQWAVCHRCGSITVPAYRDGMQTGWHCFRCLPTGTEL